MKQLTKAQRDCLEAIANECPSVECKGACDHGWYEPLRGPMLRTAVRLSNMRLIDLANDSDVNWTAGHVQPLGRLALKMPLDEAMTKCLGGLKHLKFEGS